MAGAAERDRWGPACLTTRRGAGRTRHRSELLLGERPRPRPNASRCAACSRCLLRHPRALLRPADVRTAVAARAAALGQTRGSLRRPTEITPNDRDVITGIGED